MGLDDCRRFCDLRGGTALPVYANAATMKDLKRVFTTRFTTAPGPRAISFPNRTSSTDRSQFGDLEIMPLPLPHGRMTTNGYLFVQDGKKAAGLL